MGCAGGAFAQCARTALADISFRVVVSPSSGKAATSHDHLDTHCLGHDFPAKDNCPHQVPSRAVFIAVLSGAFVFDALWVLEVTGARHDLSAGHDLDYAEACSRTLP